MFECNEHGHVCEIRMAHAPVNAMSPDFIEGLTATIEERAKAHRALVLSGLPGMFSAGLDLITLSRLERSQAGDFFRIFFGLLRTIGACPVPIAAAVTGHSPAGGAVMAIHCDYRVMARGEYKIGLNEVQVGLVVPRQIQRVFARLLGAQKAERLLVAGAMLSPDEAVHAGLVDDIVEGYEAVIGRAVEWCEMHTALPAHAMARTREIARADMASNYDDLDEDDLEGFSEAWFSEETQQIIRQIIERLKNKGAHTNRSAGKSAG